jgi:hypothetical protein
MASSELKAHLHTSRKIVSDSHTFLLWDFPDLCCDCCLQFTNCLRIVLIHIILEIPPQIKIWGVQVWWMRYVAVLMKFWASLGRRRGIDRDEQWFRQEGATPHTINDSLAWLRERLKDRLISRKCEIEWTAHSTILRDVCKCAFNSEDPIWSTFGKNINILCKLTQMATTLWKDHP